MKRVFWWVFGIALFVLYGLILVSSWVVGPPEALATHGGQLAPCPQSPNCVSSRAEDFRHAIDPILFETTAEDAMRKLQEVVTSFPRSRIVTLREDYLHAEFRSLFFRFVDDVEFLLDADHQRFHCRSASRLGYSDMGVNRRRIEEIRHAFLNTGR